MVEIDCCGLQQCRYLDLFFFSSRRRHTRLQGDWSSDVCSSDLHPANAFRFAPAEIAPGTDLIMLNYPHNPSGQVATRDWLRQLCAWCSARNIRLDRKSTRLNSSHLVISYAVFCLTKNRLVWVHT